MKGSSSAMAFFCAPPSGSFLVIEEPKFFDVELGEPLVRGSKIAPATELPERNSRIRGRERWLFEPCIPVALLPSDTLFASC
jgi:hypothetical protein